ncbi:MAG: hypothetical protein IT376_12245 [Polyangiaceae bacterium]|nr:hypothetical protein [Polyangiaceae bacterium]
MTAHRDEAAHSARRSRATGAAPRDQTASEFAAVLLRLCEATGARGAALVDQEGETVDYGGGIDPFEIKVAAAEWRIVLHAVTASPVPSWPEVAQVHVRSARKAWVLVPLAEGYALVVELPRRAFSISARALGEALRDLAAEAGFSYRPRDREVWERVEVRATPGDPRRPAAVCIDTSWLAVEVLGRCHAGPTGRREIGYRARLENGAEVTLVRERLGRWYADARLALPPPTSLRAAALPRL